MPQTAELWGRCAVYLHAPQPRSDAAWRRPHQPPRKMLTGGALVVCWHPPLLSGQSPEPTGQEHPLKKQAGVRLAGCRRLLTAASAWLVWGTVLPGAARGCHGQVPQLKQHPAVNKFTMTIDIWTTCGTLYAQLQPFGCLERLFQR